MHPQSVDYWKIQYFNPRPNPRLNPQIDPTKALYHHFVTGSRNLLMVNCRYKNSTRKINEKIY